MIWETSIVSQGDRVPQDAESFRQWLGTAHDIAEDWFSQFIEGELERQFRREGPDE